MRGNSFEQVAMLSTLTPDELVPKDHPIRRIKVIVEKALAELSPQFDAMYSKIGRPSVAPERLLKSCLLIAFYSVRSERLFCERLHYDLLFKWFLDMNADDPGFDATTFSKNRDRLIKHEVAHRFFAAVRGEAERRHLLSDEHFTVDGTLLEAWASVKSFRPNDDEDDTKPTGKNPTVSFHGTQRSNATHHSRTDPEARLARKSNGTTAKMSYMGHALMENRHGLVVDVELTQATGHAERQAAVAMLKRRRTERGTGSRWTLGGDKGYDTADFVADVRGVGVTPHVAQNVSGRRSAIDERTTTHAGYAVSQRKRKRVEEIFGWMKTVGGGRKLRYIGAKRNAMWLMFSATAFNLVRMANIEVELA
ncbi:MAG: IS5 family transposase [Candidatus Aeolococcus gillhamiae]|uniref:IS5 family transposase n=1 Tax=Candidatus Aeolococcus gillhamiae TaxID=3127015 RepID=A0A2W5ZDK0_9BACT|nr:MAG: IS5 family transposase [Candidatus Dormibacter sp. RRmetagenome_bin12]